MDKDSDPVKIHNFEAKIASSSLSQSTNAPTHESNESDLAAANDSLLNRQSTAAPKHSGCTWLLHTNSFILIHFPLTVRHASGFHTHKLLGSSVKRL